jgi:ABC-type molybdenum transport system ATPase subunit/photorepair protein PhrA
MEQQQRSALRALEGQSPSFRAIPRARLVAHPLSASRGESCPGNFPELWLQASLISTTMRRTLVLLARQAIKRDAPLLQITNATFYKQQPREDTVSAPEKIAESLSGWDDSNGDLHLHSNPPLFPDLSFSLPSHNPHEHWSIISPSSATRSSFLHILRGQYLCFPPTARSYPYLSSKNLYPAHAIQYVGFDAERGGLGGKSMKGAYLSARYESRREITDFSLLDYLLGNTELNPDERLVRHPDQELLESTMSNLKLDVLAEMPVSQLSNGQTRRARIAKALLERPELLLLDGPFMGLDPPTLKLLSELLYSMAEKQAPRLFLSLKPDEHIPEWISHILLADQNFGVETAGLKDEVLLYVDRKATEFHSMDAISSEGTAFLDMERHLRPHVLESRKNLTDKERVGLRRSWNMAPLSRDGFRRMDDHVNEIGEPLLEMNGVKVAYGEKTVLGGWQQDHEGTVKEGLWWKLHQGQRWGVFGANGSGKTTLLSLITSDHPQTYSLPIKLFGRSRLPEQGQSGISIFDIQSRIGHSSPEVHAFFPKTLSVRRTIESAWADTPLSKPKLTHLIDEKVNAVLRWFQGELHPSLGPRPWMASEMVRPGVSSDSAYLKRVKVPGAHALNKVEKIITEEELDPELLNWADEMRFSDLSFSGQRVALFLRAIIKAPDLVILDEAFSGMDDAARDKCLLFLSHGESMMFRYTFSMAGRARPSGPIPLESDVSKLGKVRVPGLSADQALLVVSHKKEEVPGCVREWLCLPQPGEGAVRFGKLDGPLELQKTGWDVIWGAPPDESSKRRRRRTTSIKPPNVKGVPSLAERKKATTGRPRGRPKKEA